MKNIIVIITLVFSTLSIKAQEVLTLSDGIQRGVIQSYGLEIARGTTQIVTEQNTWATAGAYPTLNFTASGDINTNFTASNINAQGMLNSQWTIFNGFIIKNTKSLLDTNQKLTEGLEMLQVENTIKSIIGSYYFVLMTQRIVDLSKEVYNLSKSRYEQVEDAVKLGSKGAFELIQAETALLEDEKQLMKAKLNLQDATTGLNRVMSEPDPSKTWLLSDSLEIPSKSYDFALLEEKMFSNNISLKNQYINQRAREIEVQQAQGGRYPTISLNLGAGKTYTGIHEQNLGMLNSDNNLGVNARISLSYNIFNNGRVRRETSIANINKNIENVKSEEMKFLLRNSLFMINERYEIYHSIVDLSDRQLKVLKINLEMSTERYRTGAINSFNFRDVQLSYMYNALEQLQNIYELLLIDLEMLQITGGILNHNNE